MPAYTALRYRKHARRNQRNVFVGLLVFFLLCLIYVPQGVALENIFLGGFITIFASIPLMLWFRYDQQNRKIPFFEMVFFSYAFSYGLSVLQGELYFRGLYPIPNEVVTYTLLFILVGMLSLFAGWRWARGITVRLPFSYHLNEYRLIRLMMLYMALYLILSVLQRFAIASTLRALTGNLVDYIIGSSGLAAIYGLSAYESTGVLNTRQRKYYWVIMAFTFLIKISSGWLSQVLAPVLALFFGRLSAGRLSRKLIVFIMITFLFFQAGKQAFRAEFWGGEVGGTGVSSITEIPKQIAFWISASTEEWQSLQEEGQTSKGILSSIERFNHLTWFAWVVYQTPDSIPYLSGYSYKDLYLYLIPRFLWPEKPINLEKANMIALRYGWLDPTQVGRTAVSPGLMDEAYINFGFLGIILGMFILGMFFKVLSQTLNNPKWGQGWQLLLIVLLCEKWLPLSTAASYFGGFVQPLIIILLMYLPARRKYFRGSESVKRAL